MLNPHPALLLVGLLTLVAGGQPGLPPDNPRVQANDNRVPAGRRVGDTLVVRLVAQRADWYPDTDPGPFITVEAFGEEGKAPQVPAPLIRVPTGTMVRAAIRNALPDSTIHVIGFATQPIAASETLHVAPGATAEVAFREPPRGPITTGQRSAIAPRRVTGTSITPRAGPSSWTRRRVRLRTGCS